MSRYVPAALQDHLQSGATSLTWLLRIAPVTPGYAPYGVTELDDDVEYDDGRGPIRYLSAIGYEPSEIHAAADLSVGNAEAKSMMQPVYDVPVSEEDIAAGIYDYANFDVYVVNYHDTSMGHVHILSGTIGKVSVRDDGLSFVTELRSLSARLKQEICTKYTKTCRAIDGTMPVGSSLPGEQVKRDPCGVDFTVYLKTSTVSDVGLENTLTFRIDPDDVDGDWAEANFFAPGRVKFTTGRNAGRTVEIMSTTTDGWITLRYEVGYPIEPADELEYRRGCSFIARDEAKGCKAHAGAAWIDHFKGYPDIPTENASQLMTPGAALGPGGGGRTDIPYETVQQ